METWRDFCDAALAEGFGDDEYVSLSHTDQPDFEGELVWDDNTWCIACYPTRGTNEGYYVHVDRIDAKGERHPRMIGKFWTPERAMEFSNWASSQAYDWTSQVWARFALIPPQAGEGKEG